MSRAPSFCSSVLAAGVWLAATAVSPSASAQVELGHIVRAAAASSSYPLPGALTERASGKVPLLVEYPSPSAVSDLLVGGRYRPLWLTPEELQHFAVDNPDLQLHWAPPRHALLDQASKWVGAGKFRTATGYTGQGVIVGIVDTGLDVSHRDLRDADGKSRVRYLLDFSRPAAGRQPELEEEYGCTGDSDCAIFSNQDLDDLLSNGVTGDEPRDTYGHGTHVASLAAGNGLSSPMPRYIGIAPSATLIGARVSRAGDGAIQDPDIIQATRFIFEQAERLHMPAVVNLSLGSDFGTHDGSSALEQGLASFVGPGFPGRAIVVAAGNSASLFAGIGTGEPEPYGIHTEVHVPRESPVEVPLMTPTEALGARRGATVYVWIGFREGDAVSIALDRDNKAWIPEIEPGQATTYRASNFEGTIFNGPNEQQSNFKVGDHNAVVIVNGDFDPGSVFTIRLAGHGTANLWVQATGGASPDTSVGALLPRAEKQGTINIPASHPDLIAVGATVNRNRWRDSQNRPFLVADEQGSDQLAALDGTAIFSAAGPNAGGVMKPDIIAPGMYVIGAMSSAADPRTNGGTGVFASQGRCGTPDYECFVTADGEHAVTSGTSMSAPLVSGAVALLMEARPELTQGQVRALLQAGARPPTGPVLAEQQVGPGELDLLGTLAALNAEDSPLRRAPSSRSRMALAASFIHPDPSQPLQGLLELRDSRDRIADGFDERQLELTAKNGSLRVAPQRVAPGLYSFEVLAPPSSGGQSLTLTLRYAGEQLLARSVPIGTDRWAAEGEVLAHGGCSTSPTPRSNGLLASFLAGAWLWRRRRQSTS